MRKLRRTTVLTLVGLGSLLGTLLLLGRGNEPYHAGRPLSYWVMRIWQYPGEDPAAVSAVRSIGTNALPWLMTWLQEQPKKNPARRAAAWIVDRAPGSLVPDSLFAWASDDGLRLGENASLALGLLGADARPAVPQLCKLVGERGRIGGRAAYALAKIESQDTVPALAPNLTNGHPSRKYYAWLIGEVPALATNAGPAIPALVQCLQDQDRTVARAAATTLGNVRLSAESTIPALMRYLRTTTDSRDQVNAIAAVAKFGTDARGETPELTLWLGSTNQWVRYAASNALLHIAPESLTNLPAH